MAEFDLIARIRARAAARDDVILGIGDDAALLQVPAGKQLAVTADTLNAGVHFLPGTSPVDVGWKSLAVNLSDLAAMAATPAWCTLALSLPSADVDWLDGFLDGFFALADAHGVALVGGDTTCGPLAIGVTAFGFVDPGAALRRDGARVGDDVWVSGSLGDAAAGLALLQQRMAANCVGREAADFLKARLERPSPRLALGRALAGVANAGIDLSDGLLADLGHVCKASGVAAVVEVDRLPMSAALTGVPADRRRHWQAAGGDDYELCFTAASRSREAIAGIARKLGLPMSRIGWITEGAGVEAVTADGSSWITGQAGYVHFG